MLSNSSYVVTISLFNHPLFELFLKLAVSKLLVLGLGHVLSKYIHASFYSEFGSFFMERDYSEIDQRKQISSYKRNREMIDLAITSRTNPSPPVSQKVILDPKRNTYNSTNDPAAADMTSSGECSICLMDFKSEDRISRPKACQHEFHFDCLHQWLELKDTCPCCRENLFQNLQGNSGDSHDRIGLEERILRVSL